MFGQGKFNQTIDQKIKSIHLCISILSLYLMTKVSKKDMEVFTSFSKVNFMVGDLLLGTFKIVLLWHFRQSIKISENIINISNLHILLGNTWGFSFSIISKSFMNKLSNKRWWWVTHSDSVFFFIKLVLNLKSILEHAEFW